MELTEKQRKRALKEAEQALHDCENEEFREIFPFIDACDFWDEDLPHIAVHQLVYHLYLRLVKLNLARCAAYPFDSCLTAASFLASRFDGTVADYSYDNGQASVALHNLIWHMEDSETIILMNDGTEIFFKYGLKLPIPFHPVAIAVIDEIFRDFEMQECIDCVMALPKKQLLIEQIEAQTRSSLSERKTEQDGK